MFRAEGFRFSGLGFRLSREYGNMFYRDYVGALFPYSLLATRKLLICK